jgi:hypothetical protein
MRIDEQEYKRILMTIDRMTAIDELAAYRSWLRVQYRGVERLDLVIDGKANDLLAR